MEVWLGRSLNQELHKPGIGTNYCCALFACTVHVHVNVSVINLICILVLLVR